MVHHPLGEDFFDGGVGDGGRVVVQPGEHPQHVAVHRRGGQPEADGSDGPGGVGPHPRQSQQGVVVGGQLAAIFLTHHLGRLLQAVDPAVIAQPLPQLVQPLGVAGRQGRDVGQLPDEPLIVGQGRRHPGLLEHDLADPDVVGGGVLPERQDPVIPVKPVQQGGGNLFHRQCPPR